MKGNGLCGPCQNLFQVQLKKILKISAAAASASGGRGAKKPLKYAAPPAAKAKALAFKPGKILAPKNILKGRKNIADVLKAAGPAFKGGMAELIVALSFFRIPENIISL